MSRSLKLTLILAAAVSALSAASPAAAETWKADPVLLDKSAGSCRASEAGMYTLTLESQALDVVTRNGNMGHAAVNAGGAVNYHFVSPSGASLTISGNAQTKDLTISNTNFGCYWKLVPES